MTMSAIKVYETTMCPQCDLFDGIECIMHHDVYEDRCPNCFSDYGVCEAVGVGLEIISCPHCDHPLT